MFCLQVSVVLPDTVNVSDVITESLNEDCDYYEVEDIHVSHLIKKEFIEAFVKKGTKHLCFFNKLGEVTDNVEISVNQHFPYTLGLFCILADNSVLNLHNITMCNHRILMDLWVNYKLQIQYVYLVNNLYMFLNL
jgi:hypothetical protein